MEAENLYMHAHPHFYEPISARPLSPELVDRLKTLVPQEGWETHHWDVWVGAHPAGTVTPEQGFKIHLSAIPPHAERVMELVIPQLVRRRIGFKIAGDRWLLTQLLSKRYGRGGSGKFMTIYPPDLEAFKELIEALHQATKDEDVAGPYILSDRRYKDSKVVFYRYGGMAPRSVLKADGTRRSVIRTPNGEYVPDDRTPYFQLPAWVEDPFGGTGELEDPGTPVLNGRYRIESVISFSNAGGVYRATDLHTECEVIVKEARPHAHYWESEAGAVDAPALLEREFRLLQRLAPLGFVPEAVDFFHAWEHAFLVEGVVAGGTFQQFWAHDRTILAPFIRRPGRVEAWVPRFQTVAARVLDAVDRIHALGVVLGDVSATNVFVEKETMEVALIDFESAYLVDDDDRYSEFTRTWGTFGYADAASRAGRTTLEPRDDYYGLGMLLYSAVIPLQNFFHLSLNARERFLDRLVELGLPAEVKTVIFALLAGRLDEARATLAAWTAEWRAAHPAEAPGITSETVESAAAVGQAVDEAPEEVLAYA